MCHGEALSYVGVVGVHADNRCLARLTEEQATNVVSVEALPTHQHAQLPRDDFNRHRQASLQTMHFEEFQRCRLRPSLTRTQHQEITVTDVSPGAPSRFKASTQGWYLSGRVAALTGAVRSTPSVTASRRAAGATSSSWAIF